MSSTFDRVFAVAMLLIGGVVHADDSTASPPASEAAPVFTPRAIIRAGMDRTGKLHGDLSVLAEAGVKNATSINYKIVLLDDNGQEKPFDEKGGSLRVGEQFRISLEADNDLYLYVFHEGPDGVRSVLIPDKYDDGRVPLVKRGDRKVLPDDGTYFEVTPPVGTERVMVYASPTIKPELTPKDAFDSPEKPTPGTELELKSKQDAVFKGAASNTAIPIAEGNVKQVAQQVGKAPQFRLRGVMWTPKSNPDEGKTVMVGTADEKKRPDIFLEIPLTSKQ